ncbi:MAG: ribonuclease HIII [Chlamydiota bacterium]
MSSCFVTEINLHLKDKLKEDLLTQGFQLTTPPYTVFSAKKNGVSCTLYTSGKLTVQGKGKDEFISFYLEPEILGNLSYSHPEISLDLTPRIGIDEAGKGDYFGPLCIAGIQANGNQIKELMALGVRDSKKMNDNVIKTLSHKIKQKVPYTIVRLTPKKYNELYEKFHNLNKLLAWGHATAIGDLVEKTGCRNAIIDQFADESVVIVALKNKRLDINLTQRHRGEEDLVVAAASILARSAFLEGMEELSNNVSMVLPKGAAAHVIQAAKNLVAKHGKEVLQVVAKLHFKMTHEVLGNA